MKWRQLLFGDLWLSITEVPEIKGQEGALAVVAQAEAGKAIDTLALCL